MAGIPEPIGIKSVPTPKQGIQNRFPHANESDVTDINGHVIRQLVADAREDWKRICGAYLEAGSFLFHPDQKGITPLMLIGSTQANQLFTGSLPWSPFLQLPGFDRGSDTDSRNDHTQWPSR